VHDGLKDINLFSKGEFMFIQSSVKKVILILVFILFCFIFTNVSVAFEIIQAGNAFSKNNESNINISRQDTIPIDSSSAAFHLKRLERHYIERDKSNLKGMKILIPGLGASLIILGVKEDLPVLTVGGLIIGAGGILLNRFPPPIKNKKAIKIKEVTSIPNPEERERACYKTLEVFAEEAKSSRTKWGVGTGALSILMFYKAAQENSLRFYLASIFWGIVSADYFGKSTPKRELQEYLEKIEQRKKVNLHFEIIPQGGKISLIYSF